MEPGRSEEKKLITERMLPKLLFNMYVQFCMNTKGEKKLNKENHLREASMDPKVRLIDIKNVNIPWPNAIPP